MSLRLTALSIYPLKAARGIALDQSVVDEFGLRHDRRWMVADRSGKFVSQRSHPRLALVTPSIQGESLRLDAPGRPPLDLALHPSDTVTTSVTVWGDTCPATWLGESAARWFSELLQTDCNLVHMGDRHVRPADPTFGPGGRVSFADASPFLLISEESLADLNGRLAERLPMNRFRPNLVVAGGEPYAEDGWERIEIGRIGLRLVKPCGRCVVTTTDQDTGERGQEPLRTLATYRRRDGEVMFGQNVVHENTGRLRLGDRVLVK